MSSIHKRTSVPELSQNQGQNVCPNLSHNPLGHCNPSQKQAVTHLSHHKPLGHLKTGCFSLQLQCPKLSPLRGRCASSPRPPHLPEQRPTKTTHRTAKGKAMTTDNTTPGHDTQQLDLTAIRARAEAATPGPWDSEIHDDELQVNAGTARTAWTEFDGGRIGNTPSSWKSTDRILECYLDGDETDVDDRQREADADFIAAARTDVPALVAEVERLRAVVSRVEVEAQEWEDADDAHLVKHGQHLPGSVARMAELLRTAITGATS